MKLPYFHAGLPLELESISTLILYLFCDPACIFVKLGEGSYTNSDTEIEFCFT
jgi:hypothetical protein